MDIKVRIITEAAQLFKKYGVRSISMDDIARALSISKKTIYQHFLDKNQIINIATEQFVKEECGKISAIQSKATNAVEHLHLISEGLKETFKNLNSSVLYDLKKYHRNAWDIFLDYKENKIYNEVEETLRNGVRDGYFRKEINIKILTTLRLAEIEMIFDHDAFSQNEFSLIELHTQLLDHFTYGILTEKGLELFNSYKNNYSNNSKDE